MPLKSNRKVALWEQDKKRGQWTTLSSLCFDTDATWALHLEGLPFPVLVSRQVFTNEDGSENILYLCSSDLSLSAGSLRDDLPETVESRRVPQVAQEQCLLCQVTDKLPHTQSNHFFASVVAFIKLEAYRMSARLNHFALKGQAVPGSPC